MKRVNAHFNRGDISKSRVDAHYYPIHVVRTQNKTYKFVSIQKNNLNLEEENYFEIYIAQISMQWDTSFSMLEKIPQAISFYKQQKS